MMIVGIRVKKKVIATAPATDTGQDGTGQDGTCTVTGNVIIKVEWGGVGEWTNNIGS